MNNLTNHEDYPTEDYLDEDKPFRHQLKKQNYCVISMLTPNSFPEGKREQYKDQKILGIKVRGVFEEYQEAADRASYLQKMDKYHNIFVGEVGKWLPFDVDTTNMGSEDQVYREKSLNKYMKSYKDSLQEDEETEKARKNEMLNGAKVVTGKHDATNTDLGNLDTEPEPKLNSKTYVEDNSELLQKRSELGSVELELNNSKITLEALEDKLSTIQKIYSELKSK